MSANFHGLPGSPGIGIGNAFIYLPKPVLLETGHVPTRLPPSQEWQRFLEAHARVDVNLERLIHNTDALVSDILASHRTILHDATVMNGIEAAIMQNQVSAIDATQLVLNEIADTFRSMDDDYFAGRAADVLDIGNRLLGQLGARKPLSSLINLPPQSILVAEDLTLSDIIELPARQVCGIALAHSAPTAHAAILARSREIPLVCAVGKSLFELRNGQPIIVDGNLGQLLASPSEQQLRHYSNSHTYLLQQRKLANALAYQPAVTLDGQPISVCANVNNHDNAVQAAQGGADGIGLLRTEFFFINHETFPDVAAHAELLIEIYDLMQPGHPENTAHETGSDPAIIKPLTFRALDLGGDKPVRFIPSPIEMNPSLGLRGIRLLLKRPELLRNHIAALLQMAATWRRPLRFMLPMISTIEELLEVQTHINELIPIVATEQSIDAEELAQLLPTGVLVETPAAALMIEQMATLVDFLSIGVNDLAQYILAVDRTNASVAAMADPLHPAMIKIMSHIGRAGRQAGIPVSICGEIASDATAIPLLLGLGMNELSVTPAAVALVKQAVRQCNLLSCRQLAEQALKCQNSRQVRELLMAL
ncbi:MAG: phosphoenolpyruvate--protein phosphotransferase [Caldilineaceae bacterium]|nr:phosphoenolpyruvate--protein phosphotransferase [Caldilineaceae bacterium]